MVGIADLLKLGNIGGLQLGIPKGQAAPTAPGFRSSVNVVHGDLAYDTPAEVYGAIGAVGVWTRIWEKTIPAQQRVAWGFGTPVLEANQGKMWFAILDKTTDWSVGTLRLVQENHMRTHQLTVAEMYDQQLHSTTLTTLATAALLNALEMIRLPEKVEFPLVGEDSRIGLEYCLITAATAADEAGFDIPVTIYQ